MNQGRTKVLGFLAATMWVVLGLWASPAAAGDTLKVEAVGQAAIYGTDIAAARDKAIDDALRKAVEQAAGTVVSSETITENFELVSDKIYSKSKGYVRNYKVVSEKKADGIYEVKVNADIGTGALKSDLDGILSVLRGKNMPRVLVMVSEQQVGAKSAEAWWGNNSFKTSMDVVENSIIDAWQPKGVKFVDRQTLQGKISTGIANVTDDSVVKTFAGSAGAEVVIRGDAVAQDNGPIMGTQMRSLQATVSLRAMNLDNGAIMGSATVSETVGHINPVVGGTMALKKAGQKAAEELLGKMLAEWQSEVSGSGTVSVKISGVAKSKYLKALSEFLRNEVRGVADVRQRSFRNKVAEIEVDIKGSAQDLATELEEKKFPGFAIEIDEITANSVAASLTK
ncbi:MAG: hypothetical protein A2289_08265 [Deltaproteobacteria bacterium RIFOXYA12_FULL_58_15]|nr:MAG: hypothetical protein A2289_08265 [Deltaproteobacteria bacterium RIFOXYA12_FULL_58_15]OGR09121.1 MAG: hypothetical protein A2341_10910 [Deltaproteobacteria bacterium RIFOXYB12_FULL_58_9]